MEIFGVIALLSLDFKNARWRHDLARDCLGKSSTAQVATLEVTGGRS